VERLLREADALSLGIRDTNCFLFGNFVPDIYVGWMVPDISHKIDYCTTHWAHLTSIPVSSYQSFWNAYIAGHEPSEVLDVTLGAWAHLVCDAGYNAATRHYIATIGVKPSDQTRIRKENDFELYGRTYTLHMDVKLTDALVQQCARFPQYTIEKSDVVNTVAVADTIVEKNNAEHLNQVPAYDMLTPEFFKTTSNAVNTTLLAGLKKIGSGKRIERVDVPKI
jgi:hypothetical protein